MIINILVATRSDCATRMQDFKKLGQGAIMTSLNGLIHPAPGSQTPKSNKYLTVFIVSQPAGLKKDPAHHCGSCEISPKSAVHMRRNRIRGLATIIPSLGMIHPSHGHYSTSYSHWVLYKFVGNSTRRGGVFSKMAVLGSTTDGRTFVEDPILTHS
ncbi:hypothetical protein M433DRAFT_141249 [Acidomyces richmondensis BFW]|nr:MAG: hypothetical protein FE78DRAFT_81335 [Acidomyces sp. 'richmondensis']KYG48220.1 hypothetical protein M433DRAFT_141249 [Acidomyces richmondensis BFW]